MDSDWSGVIVIVFCCCQIKLAKLGRPGLLHLIWGRIRNNMNYSYININIFSNFFLCSLSRNSNFMKYFTTFSLKNRKVNCINKTMFFRLRQQFKSRSPFLLMWTLPFSKSTDVGINWIGNEELKEIKTVIQEADKLFESNKYLEASEALAPYKESKDVEVLWRLSRALYNLAQSSVTSEADKRSLISEAYMVISEALDRDGNHWAVHKWMSVLLDAHSTYDGIKARIMQLERVKSHMLRAVELNPNDATTFYMLGSWCYQIADMPWYQRKVAATIFAAPPTSSFEEALQFFSKAEEIDPRFYSQNLLMLGKTLLRLKKQEEAVYYLGLARDYSSSADEDNIVRKEAAEILKNLKPEEN